MPYRKSKPWGYNKPTLGSMIQAGHPLAKFLVGAWIFNESAGKSVFDATRISPVGVLSGNVSFQNSPIRKALRTSTSGDSGTVTVGSYTAATNIRTLTLISKVYPVALNNNNRDTIIRKASSTNETIGWGMYMSGTAGNEVLEFDQAWSGAIGRWKTPTNASLKLNKVQTVAISYDGSSTSNDPLMYLDGISQTVTETTAPSGTISSDSGQNLTLGGRGASFDNNSKAWFAYIYFFRAILSPAAIMSIHENPYQIFISSSRRIISQPNLAAAITGTVTTATETDIVAGGKTIIITLTGDTWIAAGALSFDLVRQDIIDGLTSAQSETLGWNNTVKILQGVSGVARTSDTVVTITLDAQVTYSITADETITVTVPASALTGAQAIVATPTFTITNVSANVFPSKLCLMGVG